MLTAGYLRKILSYDPTTGYFTWIVNKSSSGKIGFRAGRVTDGYIRIKIDRKIYPAHRLAWLYVHGEWPENLIDHINGDRADNRIANLRKATYSQNHQNRRQGHGLKGVVWCGRDNAWMSRIGFHGKKIHLGTFPSPEAAHAAYAAKARELFGEFARTE